MVLTFSVRRVCDLMQLLFFFHLFVLHERNFYFLLGLLDSLRAKIFMEIEEFVFYCCAWKLN